ncbi:hypothetical protein COV16_00925 [Candidatus Woesearchaeota archaeon CG10_big_fil_rev_8_21_14_0_10_34_8]|nr:MAG: hypothetical protein COV16_00925 [Candidatus Woesearchaeota archaeon CG10_big_fil_rev_8_21_14_0_10_34_8]
MCGVFTMIEVDNPDGSKWFYHNDHLGSTTLITDEDGNIVEETFYTPFGQTTSGGEQESYYLYTNQFKDAIGCYDYGARVYCPEWYHFTSADPVIASVYDPQGLNHYSYVKNNPYKYVDPSGKRIKKGGARGSYAPAGHWSSKYGGSGGKGGGGSFYVSYWIEGRDEETKVKGITEDEFEDYQEKAKQYADTSVYGAFTSNVEQEYLVYLLEAHEGKEYEYRSATQQAIENKWIQIGAGAVVGAGVGTAATVNPIGTVLGGIIGGVATGGTFALADLSEKEAIKGQTNLRNINMAYVDTLVSGFGGLVGKAGLGVKTGDDVVIDIATDVAVGSGYEATKPYIFEGGENYG